MFPVVLLQIESIKEIEINLSCDYYNVVYKNRFGLWKLGRQIMCDVTYMDTVAVSGVHVSMSGVGKREPQKAQIRQPQSVLLKLRWQLLAKELSVRLFEVSGDQMAGSYLRQIISLAT